MRRVAVESGTFDVVSAYSFFHHLEDMGPVLAEAFRVLRSGGCLYVDLEPNRHFWENITAVHDDTTPATSKLVRDEVESVCTPTEGGRRIRDPAGGLQSRGIQQDDDRWHRPGGVHSAPGSSGIRGRRTTYEWFAGQGKILHGVSASAAGTVDQYLERRCRSRAVCTSICVRGGQAMKVLVYGSTTFGSVVRVLVEDCGHEFAGFIDDLHRGPDVLGPFERAAITSAASHRCVNAVGYALRARLAVSQRIIAAGYPMLSLVHPRAYVNTRSRLGDGCLVMAGAQIAEHVELGSGSVVWPGAVSATTLCSARACTCRPTAPSAAAAAWVVAALWGQAP